MTRAAVLALLLLVAACGQQGPLYFAPPAEPRPAGSPAPEAGTEADMEESDDGGSESLDSDLPVAHPQTP